MQPGGHHLAQLNIGRLVAGPDDPRVNRASSPIWLKEARLWRAKACNAMAAE